MGIAECEMNHTQLSFSESKGENRSVTAHWPKVPIIPKETQNQTATGWKGSLEVTWSNTPVQAGPPRSSCLGPHPNGFGIPPMMETPQLLWTSVSVLGHPHSLSDGQPQHIPMPGVTAPCTSPCWNASGFCQPISPASWGVSGRQHNPLLYQPPYQICAISKVAEGALCTIIHIMNEDV